MIRLKQIWKRQDVDRNPGMTGMPKPEASIAGRPGAYLVTDSYHKVAGSMARSV